MFRPFRLRINGKQYSASIIEHDKQKVLVRFVPPRGDSYYAGFYERDWRCDCGDYYFRRDGIDPAGCKHIQAVKVLLRTLYHHDLLPNHHESRSQPQDVDWLQAMFGTDSRD